MIYSDSGAATPVKVTTWDALGYYMYLPARHIYHDEKELKWFSRIDSIYSVSGGELYQATKHKNGNYVFKYLKGVSHLQLPFFALAHFCAQHSAYPADGFSLPYQFGIAFACLFYCIIAIFLLRLILLRYFSDFTTAVTLFLATIASNFIQYVSVDAGQSHGFIFPLYVFVLWPTIQWHIKPKLLWAFLIGLIIGIAATCRPTEAIMLFIPLFWKTQTGELIMEKFRFLKANFHHVLTAAAGLMIGVLPQLFYWKRVTGSWVYDVGSKWDFFNPHFRVLFGWEKGWFIYTPLAVLFIIGMFFMKKTEFRRPILIFCLLNIYVIISWHIWRYGGSYSCRALVQSYPLFTFPLASFIDYALKTKWKILFGVIFIYLSAVNLFQIKQYNKNIIHYDENNFRYYKAIYLDPDPDALDMSLLDTDEMIRNERDYVSAVIFQNDSLQVAVNNDTLWQGILPRADEQVKERWLKFELLFLPLQNSWHSFVRCTIEPGTTKQRGIRLMNALANEGKFNQYAFFVRIPPPHLQQAGVYLTLEGNADFKGYLQSIRVTSFVRK